MRGVAKPGSGTPHLTRCGVAVNSLFGVHGINENTISGAFAFVLQRCPAFLDAVVGDLVRRRKASEPSAEIRIQTSRRKEGITDVEVLLRDSAYLVFEAKRFATKPTDLQLRKYARRCRESGLPSALVAIIESPEEIKFLDRDDSRIDGTPVRVRTWRWVKDLAVMARRDESSIRVRVALDEFIKLMEAFLGQETMYSNYAFVVSLGKKSPDGWKTSWIDIVEKHARYFYGFQNKAWPHPPNYMGFRYRGKLQCIRHVDRFEVVDNLRKHIPGAASTARWGRHYLLHLGPPIRPHHEVKLGPRVRFSARVWCMIDTLLTCRTISDALTLTGKRERLAK